MGSKAEDIRSFCAEATHGPLGASGIIARLAEAADDIERLEAIVSKLPKCWRLEGTQRVRDVPAYPGMLVWAEQANYAGYITKWRIIRMDLDGWCMLRRCAPYDSLRGPEMGTKEFSATREAAKAADQLHAVICDEVVGVYSQPQASQ